MTWNPYGPHPYMTRHEIDTAMEVIDQYDFSEEQALAAMAAINKKAHIAPFNAYYAALAVCTEMSNAKKEAEQVPNAGPKVAT